MADRVYELTQEEMEKIKRMSTDRIRGKLIKEGYDKDLIVGIEDRAELVDMIVEWTLDEKRKEEKEEAERRRQEEKEEAERREREEERRRQEAKEEAERIERERERELKLQEIELKRLILQKEEASKNAELQMREAEIRRQTERDADEARRLNSSDVRVKRYGDALRGCVPKMPTDPVEILPWFRSVEKVFADFKIENEFKVHLLKPFLTTAAAAFVARMDVSIASDFQSVREAILHEFKLSPSELLSRFSSLNKSKDETYVVYSNRLKSLLLYYLESRKCKDFQKLIDLIVCDRIKQALPESVLRYVLSLESSREGSWMPLKDLVSNLDIYCDTHMNERPRPVFAAVGVKPNEKTPPPRLPLPKLAAKFSAENGQKNGKPVTASGSVKRCYICNSANHLASFHGKSNNQAKSRSAMTATVRRQVDSTVDHVVQCEDRMTSSSRPASRETDVVASVSEIQVDSCVNRPVSLNDDCVAFSPLKYVNVTVSDGCNDGNCVEALNDSGAEVALAHPRIFEGLNVSKCGSVNIRSAIGDSIQCDLCNVNIRAAETDTDVSIICAVTDKANASLLLPADVIDRLWSPRCNVVTAENEPVESETVNDDHASAVISQTDGSEVSSETEIVDDKPLVLSESATNLRDEQLNDPSLNSCRALCKKGKGGFFLRDGLLYRHTKIIGRPVDQLVVPNTRRADVLKMAHETFGAHQSALNTAHRIRYGLWFPSMMNACKEYVKSCAVCNRRARETCYDRVPIKPIPRDEVNFNHWMCDIAGPLFPNQNKLYNYCFVACDSKTRWPVAFALRSVNAQTICECLVKIWSVFGVSQFVSLDNAAYNSAKLTQTLLKMMGSSPIFITPHHSEGNAIAERTIGKLKESIHKMAVEQPNSWHKYLDLILWCWREIPHATLGVSPYQMAFGYLPRGPCAILRDYWTGERELPADLGKSATEYLLDLRDRLASASELAKAHAETVQSKYIARYNLRSRDKHFEIGDTVLILNPDITSSRLWSRWRAPAKIVDKRGEYSYLVEIDGSRQWIHANKLRKFDVRVNEVVCDPSISVNACSVVYEQDDDFGDLRPVELPTRDPSKLRPSQKIDMQKLAHLNDEQKTEFLAVLDKYPEVFYDSIGLCSQEQHEIRLTKDFVPKRLRPYKIPEKFKSQVDAEIQELLRSGLIKESNSPMTSPLVCILKPNGKDIRLAVDYRYLNKFTVPDPVGPPDMVTVMQKVGKAKFITTFDGKSSFWSIPLKPEDRWLTAFLCDAGEFEWTRAAFGLRNSGSSFVRMMTKSLLPIRHFTACFVDDSAVYSDEWKEHLRHVDQYLQVVRDCGLTLNLTKSEFAKPEVKFCGQIVGSGNRRIDPEKLRAVGEIKRPETKKEVRQLLGLFGWYREYIPRYSEIVCPLTNLTAKGKPNRIIWTECEQKALDALKASLNAAVSQPLHIIDWSLPFNIFSDANDSVVAGALSQTDKKGLERPIAFYSRKLNSTQRAWSTIEKEAYAILEALKRFENFVFGYEIHVYSDHNPLTYLTVAAPNSAKLLRWSLALQRFNIQFHYKAGKSDAMAVPDCLTRLVLCGDGDGSSAE